MTYSCSLGSVHSPSLHILPLSLPLHKQRGGSRAGKQGSPGPVPLRMDTVQRQKAAREAWGSGYSHCCYQNHKRERDRKNSFSVRMKSETEKLSETSGRGKPGVGLREGNTARGLLND